jgi:hypothetical protein
MPAFNAKHILHGDSFKMERMPLSVTQSNSVKRFVEADEA